MKVMFFSSRPYDQTSMEAVNADRHELQFSAARLNSETVKIAADIPAVCGFVNDEFTAETLSALAEGGTRLVTLRSTGFNNVDLGAAKRNGVTVMRVGYYSPYAVAEFAVCLMLALNRKIHKAYIRSREDYFLLDGLLGFDLHGKNVGIIGTGKIGRVLAKIMVGFGCTVLAYDVVESDEATALGVQYVPLNELLQRSDIVSLHAPLTPDTFHLIHAGTLAEMKPQAMLINTSRGALIDTKALIQALKNRRLGGAGLDVYEEEEGIFFHDHSEAIISDDVFARLLTFSNVIVTGHQGFFTREALHDIATATMDNISDFEAGRSNPNMLT